MKGPKLNEIQLAQISEFVQHQSGIVLGQSKRYLVESRLLPLLCKHELNSYSELVLQAHKSPSITQEIINAISTNETSFFRDERVFKMMRELIVPKMQRSHRQTRMWSAACSTGQEVYSILFMLFELYGAVAPHHILLVASDISTTALAQAQVGVYSDLEVGRGLSPELRQRYCHKHPKGWQVKGELRKVPQFRQYNLLIDKPKERFDFILCRNVAIYFRREVRTQVFDRLAESLVDGGILLIGATESLLGVSDAFRRCEWQGVAYYVKK